MSDVFARIESHVVAIGELFEQSRRYRPLAAEAERLYLSATRIGARVRKASHNVRGADEDLSRLAREIESVAAAVRRMVGDFLAGAAYRQMLQGLESGDCETTARLIGEVFADITPARAVGDLYLPLSAKRGEGVLDPETAADMVARMAREGIEPQSAPGVGADANVKPIRLSETLAGLDVPVVAILRGEDLSGPVFRAPEVGEVLVYSRRVKVPLSAGLRAQSPDDWLELRAGGYAEYRERCREHLTARGLAVRDV